MRLSTTCILSQLVAGTGCASAERLPTGSKDSADLKPLKNTALQDARSSHPCAYDCIRRARKLAHFGGEHVFHHSAMPHPAGHDLRPRTPASPVCREGSCQRRADSAGDDNHCYATSNLANVLKVHGIEPAPPTVAVPCLRVCVRSTIRGKNNCVLHVPESTLELIATGFKV